MLEEDEDMNDDIKSMKGSGDFFNRLKDYAKRGIEKVKNSPTLQKLYSIGKEEGLKLLKSGLEKMLDTGLNKIIAERNVPTSMRIATAYVKDNVAQGAVDEIFDKINDIVPNDLNELISKAQNLRKKADKIKDKTPYVDDSIEKLDDMIDMLRKQITNPPPSLPPRNIKETTSSKYSDDSMEKLDDMIKMMQGQLGKGFVRPPGRGKGFANPPGRGQKKSQSLGQWKVQVVKN